VGTFPSLWYRQVISTRRSCKIEPSPLTGTEKSAPKKAGEQIQRRAYLIAERRKSLGVSGDETGDWAQAERELRAEATGK
jgi:hypothetical protein